MPLKLGPKPCLRMNCSNPWKRLILTVFSPVWQDFPSAVPIFSGFYALCISPASSNPFFAAITAINSLMIAAEAIVPYTICTSSGARTSVEQMIPGKSIFSSREMLQKAGLLKYPLSMVCIM